MEVKTVGVACDHAGFALKKFVLEYLDEKGYLVDAPKAVFRMVRDCLLSGQLLGEHTERIALATPTARNL